MARSLRDALEDLHAGTASKRSGLSDPVMAFVNRRVARYCYEELGKLTLRQFLSMRDWQAWIDGMWAHAVTRTNLNGRVFIAKTPWIKVCRTARYRLHFVRFILERSMKEGIPFETYAVVVLPAGWDSPSLDVPATFCLEG